MLKVFGKINKETGRIERVEECDEHVYEMGRYNCIFCDDLKDYYAHIIEEEV